MTHVLDVAFFRALFADASLDAPFLDGWVLADVHGRLKSKPEVWFELVSGDERCAVAARVAGRAGELGNLELSSERSDLVALMSRELRRRLDGARPTFAPGPRWDLAPSWFALPAVRPLPWTTTDEGSLLAVDASRYGAVYGGQTRIVQVPSAPGPSIRQGEASGRVPESGALRPVPERFGRRRFREYLARRGYVAEADGLLRTVPLPSTFALACPSAPLMPRMVASRTPRLSAKSWSAWVLEGTLPISVAPSWAVAVYRLARSLESGDVSIDVGMVAHDMSLHAFALHSLPAGVWAGVVATAKRERGTASALAELFEGDLTRSAWDTWGTLDDPSEFADRYAAKLRASGGLLSE